MSWPVKVVGPRQLPESGTVEVWFDTGSRAGVMRPALPSQLVLDPADNGEGTAAIYEIRPVKADCQ
ncbi:hypothetical protein [Actinoplanes sp. NPDC026670]|uniref:hypothetical protein n=1 Tax=Actinoplanes sp. NPDC026670 TaxID=3154700 RepID=UPI0034086DF5